MSLLTATAAARPSAAVSGLGLNGPAEGGGSGEASGAVGSVSNAAATARPSAAGINLGPDAAGLDPIKAPGSGSVAGPDAAVS